MGFVMRRIHMDEAMNGLGTNLLSVRGLQVSFFGDEGEVPAVDDLSFDVAPGEVVGLVGESGCGKSVTARSILRMIDEPGRMVGGELWFRTRSGEPVDLARFSPRGKEMRRLRGKEIGLIFQEPMTSLSPVHTVGEQLVESIRLYDGVGRKDAMERAADLLRQVEIPNPGRRLNEYAFQLSGGLRQRVMIALALSGNPQLLIADEPTTALDVTTQAQVLELLRKLREERNMALIMITHDLGMVAQIADKVVVMYLGKAVENATVDAIFHAPRHPYTRALLKSLPSVHGPTRGKLPTIPGSVPGPSDRVPGCSFGPRCESFTEGVCDVEVPAVRALGASLVRCHLAVEEA